MIEEDYSSLILDGEYERETEIRSRISSLFNKTQHCKETTSV
jgi:hypothetical protein